ncbi:P-loop containing nucleoside triphosphate hydrolase protein [Russula earlei]|uniref:P-loop containing nucleoside triphosphate hydrolase protein n=1 Tax=Russula earlei TaxID=71964 RepID=A0ACC0UFF8_9AGAM|nr:P-loop containing nucleoside triphosphate hydrolase protein [Russula earlei]
MGMLMAGTKYKGKYKERIKCVLNEVEKAAADSGPSVILFIDELYLIMVSCGSEVSGMDAANLFKLLLAHRKLHRIVAMTLAEYRKYIKTDATLECQFAQVLINKPTVPKTISILRSICKKYEVHHGMQILNSTLIMAATLACCYLTARWLPDSTINLVDEACASVHVTCKTAPEVINKLQCQKLELEAEYEKASLGGADIVTLDQVAEIVAHWLLIPVTHLMSTEKEKLLHMEKILSQSVVGQPKAVKAIANPIRLSYSSLGNAKGQLPAS